MTANNNEVFDVTEAEEKENLTPREKANIPATEELDNQTEEQLIEGLLFAADAKFSADERVKINIKRGGRPAFSFEIRPLSEDELFRLRKSSTPYYPNPANKRVPIEGEMRYGEFRSKKVYTATAEDENGKKIWDNPKLKAGLKARGFDIIEPWEIIDKVLLAGEKDAISDKIDEISGYEMDLTDYAKN